MTTKPPSVEKPGLTASEACHRLAPIEGQKENKQKREGLKE
jgi:hypothetical protein